MKIIDLFRQDGWVNSVIGFGQAATDRRLSGYHGTSAEPSRVEYESLYNENGLAARIVEALPNAALRQGIELTTESDMDAELKTAAEQTILARMVQLNTLNTVRYAAYMGRLFGGAGLFVATSDSDWSTSLDTKRPGEILYLRVFDRWEMRPKARYKDPQSTEFGDIESYSITSADSLLISVPIHASRLHMFWGDSVSRREHVRLGYWNHSVLRRVRDDLRDHDLTWGSVANMVLDASVGVLKIGNFYEIMAGKLKEQFRNRLDIINMGRSASRILPIDIQEDFSHQERTFTGLPDVLDRQMQRLSSLTGIPVTVLYGRSPAGLNATGESDTRYWYDLIEDYRKTALEKPITNLVRLIAYEQGITDPESWGIRWPSLWQETPQEHAERQAKVADTDAKYIDSGVLLPDEIALARYGTGQWSDSAPQLDMDGRTLQARDTDDE